MTAPAHNPTQYRQALKPMPLRIALTQYERLSEARDRTGISIQEHVRRAVDLYLAALEKEHIELGMMATPDPENLTVRAIRAKTALRPRATRALKR